MIVRLQELTGQSQAAQLTCAAPITAARQLTGIENPVATLTPSNGTLTVSLGAYAPVTLALTLPVPDTLVSTPVSAPVVLPYNLDAISTDGNRTDGNFDSGHTYPAELMPATIVRDGVTFQLGPTNDGAFNALQGNKKVLIEAIVSGEGHRERTALWGEISASLRSAL